MSAASSLDRGPALSPNAWLRFDLLRDRLAALPTGRVLEVGPGRGAIAARLVAAGHAYTGVELSDDSRDATRRLLATLDADPAPRLVASLDEIGPDERFDLVGAFEVLEHIEADEAALRSWADRLVPGGTLLLSVPAWQSRFSSQDVEVGHIRRYDPDDLRELAERVGLTDVQVELYGFPLGYVLERGRVAISDRRQAARPVEHESTEDRTKRSGAQHQPPRWSNLVVRTGTWPFRVVQRRVSDRGTGLVLVARAPSR